MTLRALLALAAGSLALSGCGSHETTQAHRAGALRIGVLYTVRPALFLDEQGRLTGFLYDIEVELGKRMNRPLDFRVTTFENIITGVQSGKFDIGTGTDATVERQKILDIIPIFEGGYTLRARDDGPRIGSAMMDLCGLRLGSSAGGVILPLLRSTSERCLEAGREPIALMTMPNESLLLLALQSRRIDGLVAFNWYPPSPGTILTGPTFANAQSGMAVRKDSPLAGPLVAALNAMIADGTYGKILARYRVSQTALERSNLNPAR